MYVFHRNSNYKGPEERCMTSFNIDKWNKDSFINVIIIIYCCQLWIVPLLSYCSGDIPTRTKRLSDKFRIAKENNNHKDKVST